MEFLIGADPEFFVKKDGQFVSAHGLIEGTKADPVKVDGGAIQVDGVALEFNIDPASTFKEFNTNIDNVLRQLRERVPAEYEFVFEPVAHFTEQYIAELPLEARRLGCDPDFNAWDQGKANPTPNAGKPFRTASGHIHIGWTDGMDILDPEHLDACMMMVKQLDTYIGAYSPIWDRDNTRRELYGKAGAFRPKSYGVEYRVMSNAWLKEPWIRKLVFDQSKKAFDALLDGKEYFARLEYKLPKYINIGDYMNAFHLVNNYIAYPDEIYRAYEKLVLNKKDQPEIAKVAYDLKYGRGPIKDDPFIELVNFIQVPARRKPAVRPARGLRPVGLF